MPSNMEGFKMKGNSSLSVYLKRPARWVELYRQRRQLASLSDAALADLGLSRADTLQEVERPFWDDPFSR
ncbi:hypothetical protein PS627_01218 [Pseudomonas fluorescens]|nr:DUF1127 domain-containing protein [Pseudomonas fluorescens]CAG8865319.1 hypothetical protein PS627_01218 [Pseudomonas fluorescens]VVP66620.1 hypothetical protein PS910_00030 [Pseudomonas fluorescens]